MEKTSDLPESIQTPDSFVLYNNTLSDYYQLKQEYEKRWNKIKRKIKNMDISNKEKRARLKRKKVKCIQCKQPGGTLFTNKDGVLKAVCGHKAKPCKLHIELKKGKWKLVPSEIEDAEQVLERLKKRIIETKLELLFGLEEEDGVIKRFEQIKQKYESWYAHLVDLETLLEQNYNWKEKKEKIEKDNLKLYILNEEFKEAIEEFKKSNNLTNLQEAIEIYIKQILPVEKNLEHNKYSSISVCCTTEDTLWCKEDDKTGNEKNYIYVLKTPQIGILENEEEWDEGIIIAADKI